MIRLARAQVREVDRRAIEDYHVPGIVLMENAARAAADAAREMLGGSCTGQRVLILCGGGNNGGDGLAVARMLHNRGAQVTVGLTIDPARYKGDALVNWNIVRAMKLAVVEVDESSVQSSDAALLVDAVFGTGLGEPPREPFAGLAHAVNVSGVAVLAIDVPSGLDCDTGRPLGPACVRANVTVTFVAEKVGFANPETQQYLGLVVVGDIGCPAEAIERVISAPGPT